MKMQRNLQVFCTVTFLMVAFQNCSPMGGFSTTDSVLDSSSSNSSSGSGSDQTPPPEPAPPSQPSPTTTTTTTTSTTTTTLAPPSAGTRDPLKQPFASNSIWNMPIGSGARFVAANMHPNPDPSGFEWAPLFNPDPERIVLTPTAPLTTFNYSDAGWSGKNRCAATSGTGYGLPIQVPMPTNYVVPNDNSNSGAAFLMPDKRTIIQMQPIARCTAGGPGTALVAAPEWKVDLYGDGIRGAHGGSGMSSIGGAIRIGELRPGQQGMRHALKINVGVVELYDCATKNDCYRWPAVTADSGWRNYGDGGPNANNPAMKMGALLAIPGTVDLNSLGFETDPGRQMAWTLQNYGGYIVDTAFEGTFDFSVEDGANGSVEVQFQKDYGYPLMARYNTNSPWSRDLIRIRQVLRVVDNNSATSIGGGGTPRQPLAPAIAP